MVESDYKNNRVSDPTKISSKQVKAVKKYVVDFFNKAVKKRRERDHEKRKKMRAEADKKAAEKAGSTTPPKLPIQSVETEKVEDEEDVQLSDDEMDAGAASDDENDKGKRKRQSETPATPLDGEEESTAKKLKLETPPPPPPPPPPPAEDEDEDMGESATPKHDLPLMGESGDWEKEEDVKQEASPADTTGGASKDYPEELAQTNGHHSPVQLATPSTNGTYEHDLKVKANQKAVAAGGQ
jgi:hypothetical protein